jgi:hypothetical protein
MSLSAKLSDVHNFKVVEKKQQLSLIPAFVYFETKKSISDLFVAYYKQRIIDIFGYEFDL